MMIIKDTSNNYTYDDVTAYVLLKTMMLVIVITMVIMEKKKNEWKHKI